MSDRDQLSGTPFDTATDGKKIPGRLKTLTTLTFIGCAILFILTIYSVFTAKQGLEALEKMQGSEQLEKMPDFFKNFYTDESIALARTRYENRIPLTIIELVGLTLCVLGAKQMRSLQKQGYYLWVLGNIVPIVGSIIFVGMATLTGFGGLFFLGIVLLFFILYSTQLKYMK